VQDFYRIYDSLKENAANIQDFQSVSAKKRLIANKSCKIAGFYNIGNKTWKNDVFLHYFWFGNQCECVIRFL